MGHAPSPATVLNGEKEPNGEKKPNGEKEQNSSDNSTSPESNSLANPVAQAEKPKRKKRSLPHAYCLFLVL